MNEATLKKLIYSETFKRTQEQESHLQKILSVNNLKYKKPISLIKQSKNKNQGLKPVQQVPTDKTKKKQFQNQVEIHLVAVAKDVDQLDYEDKRITLNLIDQYIKDYIQVAYKIFVDNQTSLRIFTKGILKFLQNKLKDFTIKDFDQKNNTKYIIRMFKHLLDGKIVQTDLTINKNKTSPLLSDFKTCDTLRKCLLILTFIKFYALYDEKQVLFIEDKDLGVLIQVLDVIEHRSFGKQDELLAMKQLLNFVSYYLIFQESKMKPKNFYRFLKYNQKIFVPNESIEPQKVFKYRKHLQMFYLLLQKFIVLERNYNQSLKQLIFSCIQLEILTPPVRQHFKVICNLVAKRIFPNFEKAILKEFYRPTTHSNRELPFIALMIDDLLSTPNFNECINMCSQQLIAIGQFGVQIKTVLIQKLYPLISENKIKIDKVIYNSLLEWQIQEPVISHTQFCEKLIRKNIEMISEENLRRAHATTFRPFSILMVQTFLQQKMIKYLEVDQEAVELCKIFSRNSFISLENSSTKLFDKKHQNIAVSTTSLIYYEKIIKAMTIGTLSPNFAAEVGQNRKEKSESQGALEKFFQLIARIATKQNQTKKSQLSLLSSQPKFEQIHQNVYEMVHRKTIQQQYLLAVMILFECISEGYSMTIRWNYYAQKVASLQQQSQELFKEYLYHLVKIFKCKFAFFMSIICFISKQIRASQNNSPIKRQFEIILKSTQQKLPLQETFKCLISDQYSFVNCYSEASVQALIILREISFVNSRQQKTKVIDKIICGWKSFFSGFLSKEICYSFSWENQIKRQIIQCMKNANKRNNSEVKLLIGNDKFGDHRSKVIHTFELIHKLLQSKVYQKKDQPCFDVQDYSKQRKLLCGKDNHLVILPIQDRNTLADSQIDHVKITFQFLSNGSVQVNNYICLKTSQNWYKIYLCGRKIGVYSKKADQSVQSNYRKNNQIRKTQEKTSKMFQKSKISSQIPLSQEFSSIIDSDTINLYQSLKLQEIRPEIVSKNYRVTIIHNKKKVKLQINNQLILQFASPEPILSVKLQMKSNILCTFAQVKKSQNAIIKSSEVSFTQSYFVHPNFIEIKLKKPFNISCSSFVNQNFDFVHIFQLIKSLHKNSKRMKSGSHILNTEFSFSTAAKIGLRLISCVFTHQQAMKKSLRSFRDLLQSIFKNISQTLEASSKRFQGQRHRYLKLPKLPKPELICATQQFYHFFVTAFVRKQFWDNCTSQCKFFLLKYLENLLFMQGNCFKEHQKMNSKLFLNLFQIIKQQSRQIQNGQEIEQKGTTKAQKISLFDWLISIVETLILNQQPNQNLIWKFKHFIYCAEGNPVIQKKLQKFIILIIDTLKHENIEEAADFPKVLSPLKSKIFEDESQLPNQRQINSAESAIQVNIVSFQYHLVSKYILCHPKILELIVSCTKLYKEVFFLLTLPYFMPNEQFQKLISFLPNQNISDIIDTVFVLMKETLTVDQAESGLLHVKLVQNAATLIFGNWNCITQENKEEFIVIYNAIFTTLKRKNDKKPGSVSIIVYNTLLTTSLLKFCAQEINQLQSTEKVIYQKFTNSVFQFYLTAPKQPIIRFFTCYRKVAQKTSNSIQNLLHFFKDPLLILIYSLPLYGLNAFLQYLYQATIIVKNGVYPQAQSRYFNQKIRSYIQYLLQKYQKFVNLRKKNSKDEAQTNQTIKRKITMDKNYIPSQPILYVYPKALHQSCLKLHQKDESYQETEIFKQKICQFVNQAIVQLRGGVYFKLLLIISNILQIQPTLGMFQIVQNLVFKGLQTKSSVINRISFKIKNNQANNSNSKGQKGIQVNPTKNQMIFRAISDFSNVIKQSYDRTAVTLLMKECEKQHQRYFKHFDVPIKKIVIKDKQKYQQMKQQNDLSPFFIDLFLMKLAIILETNVVIQEQVLRSYSHLIVGCLEEYPYVMSSLKEKNIEQKIIDNYEVFRQKCKMVLKKQRNLKSSRISENQRKSSSNQTFEARLSPYAQGIDQPNNFEISSTPKKRLQQSPFQPAPDVWKQAIKNMGYSRHQENELIQDQKGRGRSQTQGLIQLSPRKSFTNKKSPSKRRKSSIEFITQDPQGYWSQNQNKNFHKYFCDEAKQLLVYQFFHIFYIQNGSTSPQKDYNNKVNNQFFHNFIHSHEASVQKELKQYNKYYLTKLQQTKAINECMGRKNQKNLQIVYKIYPYTSELRPIWKVKAINFPNMTRPIANLTTKFVEYKVNHRMTELLLYSSRMFQDSPQRHPLVASVLSIEQEINDQSQDEQQINNLRLAKIKSQQKPLNNYCQLITRKGVLFAEWRIDQQYVQFISKAQKSKALSELHPQIKFGSPDCNVLNKAGKKIIIPFDQIHQIFFRKYNQTLNNSLEFFLKNGRSHFLVLYTKKNAEWFIQKLVSQKGFSKSTYVIRHYKSHFDKKKYTERWVNNQMSNFDYLMAINKYAGRSYSDLNQYYVFPWILKDYKSKSLDLSDQNFYRDLGKPIGALNPIKLKRYKQKLDCLRKLQKQSDQNMEYLYGSHYSTSLFIYYYLVRLEPFTTLHRQFQSGNFDSPDRLFNSISEMWDCLMNQSNASDIKQSIPEFYYLPCFLKNMNRVNLGTRQSGEQVGDVELPKWSHSAQDFVLKMRAALQSDYVSANLHKWIDLIFGKYQCSFEKNNVFHPLSYYKKIDFSKIQIQNLESTICQISFFGQNPLQLFEREHPTKIQPLEYLQFDQLKYFDRNKKLKQSCIVVEQAETFQMVYQLQVSRYIKEVKYIDGKICLIVDWINAKQNDKKVQYYLFDLKNEQFGSLINKLQKRECLNETKQQQVLRVPHYQLEKKSALQLCTVSKIKNKNKGVKGQQGYLLDREIIKQIRMTYDFNSVIHNEMFIVLYGNLGLQIRTWNNDIFWQYISNEARVVACSMHHFGLIFATNQGKCFLFDLVCRRRKLIYSFDKKTYDLQMFVTYSKKRKPKPNQNKSIFPRSSRMEPEPIEHQQNLLMPDYGNFLQVRMTKKYSDVLKSVQVSSLNNNYCLYKILLIGDKRKIGYVQSLHQFGNIQQMR